MTATGSVSTTGGRERLPAVVWLVGAAAFLTGTSEMIVTGLLPELAARYDVGLGTAGLLVTVFATGMMAGAPIMALATLRLPRRTALVAALIVFAAGHVLGALAPSFALALAGRFLAALATGTFWAVGAVVATTAAGPSAGARAMSVLLGGATLAAIVGVPAGAVAGRALGWQGPFWVLAASALAAAAVLARRLPAVASPAGTTVRGELAAVRHPRLWLIYPATALMQGAVLAVYSYVAPALTDRAGLAPALVPLVMLGFGAAALAGSRFGGRLGDRHPAAVTLGATAACVVLTAAISLGATSPPAAVLLYVLLGVPGMVFAPAMSGQIIGVAGTGHVLPLALSTSAVQVGIALGSWGGGLALESGLGLRGPALVGLAFAVLAAIPVGALALTRRCARAGMIEGRPMAEGA
ncbi:MFS transporter [Actinoplanes sp. NBRC 101535]|uniref:MFS transporter n=1 Tax=Actinoplanes sp. NBRC 101535 TaxID=3032196 RepID=UPI0024A023EE|nr:MFS transporter [Actinoplanes sp. NBRC 101535]GLY06567.1 MFS transporter [Actinoplanes sp. NBRC 101535]